MEEELKEILNSLKGYIRKRWKKIVSWVVFIFGIYSIILGFMFIGPFLWGIPLTIVAAFILKDDLGKIGLFFKALYCLGCTFWPYLPCSRNCFPCGRYFSAFFSSLWLGYSFYHPWYPSHHSPSYSEVPCN